MVYTEAGEDYEDEVEKQAASNGITVEQQKQINLLLNLPQHVLPTVERMLGLAAPTPSPAEPVDPVAARAVTANVNAYDPNQPRDEQGRLGEDGSGTSSERPRDRDEGTQREANREVSRANAAVRKAESALSKAEAKSAEQKKEVKELKSKLSATQQKIADLEALKAKSAARIAALKSQLKGEFQASIETDLAKEQERLVAITKQLADVASEAERLAAETDALVKRIAQENEADE